MSTTRRQRLSRTAAEQLLRGRQARRQASGSALAGLLAAAAAPPRDRELAGEHQAVAAFREARLSPANNPRRPEMSAAKLLAVKALIAVLGVSGGGVALAAATGHLPAQPGGSHSPASPAAAAPAAAHSTPSAAGHPASHPGASPSPSVRGLCQAYTAHPGSNPGKSLGNPAFTALISAAGGKDHVAAYCAAMLAAKPGNAPTAHPVGKPAAHPSHAPTTHPKGKPAGVPTPVPPVAHPTGARPTPHP